MFFFFTEHYNHNIPNTTQGTRKIERKAGFGMVEKVMLTVREVMVMTGLGRNKAYELMKSGDFHVKKIGSKHLVHKDTLENYLKGEKPKRPRW
jgi:excisionase family DNA binding protein